MNNSAFSHSPSWIWSDDSGKTQNLFLAFRRVLDLPAQPESAVVRITADSRYELFVNGEWLGHGPARSFPSPWPVDSYDIAHLLREGPNVVAVLVNHFGISTFQYIAADPGLIAEVEWDINGSRRAVVTDGAWRVRKHDGYETVTQRISCQQAWEEQFDARREPGDGWTTAAFDDAAWARATVVRAAGQAPHESFEPRDIPFLSREAVEPTRVVSAEIVKPAPYTWSINPRPYLNATDLSANMLIGAMLLETYIHSDVDQDIQAHLPHHARYDFKLNGAVLKFDDMSLHATDTGVATGRLKRGWNTLLVRMPGLNHLWSLAANFWTDSPVIFSALPEKQHLSPWSVIGPFSTPDDFVDISASNSHVFVTAENIHPDARFELFKSIWEAGDLSPEQRGAPWVTPAAANRIAAHDIYASCASERIVPGASPRIDEMGALAAETASWAIIHPSKAGDVRLLIDFGKEVVGFHEFEVDAPEGAILDFHNFEFIQHDGRFNLAEGMNNSFRYVCRKGHQTYRTFVRRGLRYSWISVRGFDEPVKLRAVRVLMSTYPPAAGGDFSCSDATLTRIWEVGAHSVRCCSEDTYTDCPTYEQTHWVGDARNEALVDLVANGDPRLSRHCWTQIGRSLDRSPLVESQTPSGWENILPAWSFLWMRWAHEHYVLTGDREFGREALGFIDRNVQGIKLHLNDRGLFHKHAWNMFDWAPMDTHNSGIVTHIICLAVLGLRQAATLAILLGDRVRQDRWNELADQMAQSVNEYLWNPEHDAYVDCIRPDGTLSPVLSQQTHTAAYISGVAQGDRALRCREIIECPPEGFVTAGSPFFMFFMLEVFVSEGRFDLMQNTIRDYWGPQIEAGATTFWEQYHPHAARLTRSHCHGWSAAPTFFLSQHVLGVQPLEPGYGKIKIAPQPADLRWAHGRVPTPHGVVTIYWKRGEKLFDIQFDTPEGIMTAVQLPFPGKVQVIEGGPRIVAESPTILESFGGRARVAVDMG
ncbi:MAG: family 78 glycoside hydrolase catalytic domain [Capsulimonadaceae bacterium]|nr:family 78 glycoside hydrolase catalytic domain [Capsulimonadaceae bacterium]